MKKQAAQRIKVVVLSAVAVLSFGSWLVFTVLLPRKVLGERLHQAMSVVCVCKLYAADHRGKYPEHLADLIPEYLPDDTFLKFSTHDGSRQLTLEYFGGAETDPPDTVLIRVSAEPPGGPVVIVHSDASGVIQSAP